MTVGLITEMSTKIFGGKKRERKRQREREIALGIHRS